MYYIPNKLLYMAVPKTGSTAITNHLNQVFDCKGVKCVKTKQVESTAHPTIWEIDERWAEKSFFCTVVRNPYSRFVSHYFYSLHLMQLNIVLRKMVIYDLTDNLLYNDQLMFHYFPKIFLNLHVKDNLHDLFVVLLLV